MEYNGKLIQSDGAGLYVIKPIGKGSVKTHMAGRFTSQRAAKAAIDRPEVKRGKTKTKHGG